VILTVKVIPRASKPGIAVDADGSLKVRLQSPPVEGAANAELVELLAKAFSVPRRAVTITAGAHARVKRVQIDGVDESSATEVGVGAGHRSRPPRRRLQR